MSGAARCMPAMWTLAFLTLQIQIQMCSSAPAVTSRNKDTATGGSSEQQREVDVDNLLRSVQQLKGGGPTRALNGSAQRTHGRRLQTDGVSDQAKQKVQLTDTLLERFIILPEKKLLFCYIEKVACTAFNELIMEIRGQTYNPSRWQEVYFRNDMKAHGIDKAAIEEMMVDPAWHKAVFYREPLGRFVSGYKSKCEKGRDFDGPQHCGPAFKKGPNPQFEEVVETLAHHRADAPAWEQEMNEHWQLQSRFCGGLDKSLHLYDTVEQLHKATARQQVIQMLKAVGVQAESVNKFDELFPEVHVKQKIQAGFHAKGGTTSLTGAHHATHAEDWLKRYVTKPKVAATLLEHYMEDYLLFGMQAPQFAVQHLASRPPHKSSMDLPAPWPVRPSHK